MPELPEVECARRLLDEHCVGAKICAVNALEAGGGPRDGQFDDVVICEVCILLWHLRLTLCNSQLSTLYKKSFDIGSRAAPKCAVVHQTQCPPHCLNASHLLHDEQDVTAEQLTAALLGRTLKHAGRKGKQLWLELDGDGPHPLFHLGMTGNLSVEGIEAPSYKSFKV
jgi:Formamidopyrimidine-DNA glycosylase N-terminal domain